MRKLILAAAGLALLAPAALVPLATAQTAPAAAPAASTAAAPAATDAVPGQPPARPSSANHLAELGAPPPPPPGGPHGMGGPGAPPPPPPTRGAHVRLEHGDARVDLKCADEDSTQSCATIAQTMLDRLAATAPSRN